MTCRKEKIAIVKGLKVPYPFTYMKQHERMGLATTKKDVVYKYRVLAMNVNSRH